MSFVAGQRIEARCSRCKDTTGHIVIVVVDDVPMKVECVACKSVHKFYLPAGQKKKVSSSVLRVRADQERGKVVEQAAKQSSSKSTLSSTAGRVSASAGKKKTLRADELENLWKNKLMKCYAEPKKYRMDAELSLGDSVEHSLFGTGVVEEVVANDKANILFKDGYKILKCIIK